MRNERFYRGYRDRAGQPHSCIITPLLSDGLLYTVTVHRREAAGAGRECIVASSTKERLRKLLSSSVCAAALLVASIKTVGVCLCPISDRASVCVCACVCVYVYAPNILTPTQFLSLRSDDSVRGSGVILNLSDSNACQFSFFPFYRPIETFNLDTMDQV